MSGLDLLGVYRDAPRKGRSHACIAPVAPRAAGVLRALGSSRYGSVLCVIICQELFSLHARVESIPHAPKAAMTEGSS